MAHTAMAPHSSNPVELQAQLAAERRGLPYLLYRDEAGRQRLVAMDAGIDRLTVGRSSRADVALPWDPKVSRVHVVLERMLDGWTVLDDGRARNGTFVNDKRLYGRKRLQDRDRISIGDAVLVFRHIISPSMGGTTQEPTASGTRQRPPVSVSEAQRRVLVALCRPFGEERPFATPASNEEIAAELVLSLDAVKSHMRLLFQRFGLEGESRGRKRARLVQEALKAGVVTESDYPPTARV